MYEGGLNFALPPEIDALRDAGVSLGEGPVWEPSGC